MSEMFEFVGFFTNNQRRKLQFSLKTQRIFSKKFKNYQPNQVLLLIHSPPPPLHHRITSFFINSCITCHLHSLFLHIIFFFFSELFTLHILAPHQPKITNQFTPIICLYHIDTTKITLIINFITKN